MDRGVLVVDDEELILSSLGRELRPWLQSRGLVYYQARSATEALEFLAVRHRQVMALVTDLRMPGMTGDALVNEVHQRWPAIGAILMSGYAEMQGLARAVSAGISGFVPKPWEPASLVAELEKALNDRETARQAGIRAHELNYQLTRTRELQKSLFRNDDLDPTRFVRSLVYRPLSEQLCGGDFYEIISLGPDRCAVLLGDVSGHGAEAAFFTGVIHTLITQEEVLALLAEGATTGQVLSRLNRLVFDQLSHDQSRTVALTMLLFDRHVGRVQLSSAGGLPVVVVRQGRGLPHLSQGLPLGFTPEADYPVLSLDLRPGDRWVAMTDGAVDRGQRGFLSGAEVVATVTRALAAGNHLETVFAAFQAASAGPLVDDLTLVELEVV